MEFGMKRVYVSLMQYASCLSGHLGEIGPMASGITKAISVTIPAPSP